MEKANRENILRASSMNCVDNLFYNQREYTDTGSTELPHLKLSVL